MSIHRSLKIRGGLARARNVLTRVERIEKLRKDKKFGDDDSVFGLPKVKVVVIKAKKKEKKAPEAGEDAEAPVAEVGGSPPQ
jgi:small basic protein (TIGR04137 family)